MDDTISYLNSHGIIVGNQEGLQASANSTTGVKFGMLWIDIEGTQVRFHFFFILPLGHAFPSPLFPFCFSLSTGQAQLLIMLTLFNQWLMKEKLKVFLLVFIPLLLNGLQSWVAVAQSSVLFLFGMLIMITIHLSVISNHSVDGQNQPLSNMRVMFRYVLLVLTRTSIKLTIEKEERDRRRDYLQKNRV
jgi:hypothetical protein